MLQITDINTHENTLAAVTRLKEEFRVQMTGVTEGNVIIISNFPAIGHMVGPLDYLIIISVVYGPGNFLFRKVAGRNLFINNAIIHINSVRDDEVTGADDFTLQKADGAYEYIPALKAISNDLHDYLEPYANIQPYGIYRISSENAEPYHQPRLMLNYPLTAKFLLWSICWQTQNERKIKSVSSFPRNHAYTTSNGAMSAFATKMIGELEERTTYGILTKKKIDRISTSIKKVEEIYDNIGQTLSVITGKAGTGKTLLLTRVIQRHSKDHKVARLLTFNKLLVLDLIQTLRNFPHYSNVTLSVQTVHQFFYYQAHLLGITLIMGEERVKELLQVCRQRIGQLQESYENYFQNHEHYKVDEFLAQIGEKHLDRANHKEFILFANFLKWTTFDDFAAAQSAYLVKKKSYLEPNVGQELFLEDYPNVLQKIYEAVTDSGKFYEANDIKNRYELLKMLYRLDKDEDRTDEYIAEADFQQQVRRVKGSVNWSRLFLIDECQDCFVWEKEILFHVRGPERIVVASGGKEQLIRQGKLLDWTVSLGKPVPFKRFRLDNISYRQKQNIVAFVNAFGAAYGLPINLQSVAEQNGVGKVVIDRRPNSGLLQPEIAADFKLNGEINGCSPYESLLIMLPARGYTEREIHQTIHIDEMDVVQQTQSSANRHTKGLDVMTELGYFCWDGVAEDKSKLKVPHQTDTRIIHYESCRGLEAWSCALMSMDQFFVNKWETDEAATHLSDDLFLTEGERRDKFAALWCLMAITRPIDTLYIHLENPEDDFSQLLLKIAAEISGAVILT